MEATYVYPLPPGGAVDTLKMVVGDRVVVGDIKERQQARVIYERAKANGQKAALTEQERPNIFTNSVANIGPGETVLVQIEYQEPVQQNGNEFSLRVPLVVGPRYNPAPVDPERRHAQPMAAAGARPHPIRSRTATASRRRCSIPPSIRKVNPTSITVHLQGRLSARRGEEPSSPGQDRKPGRDHARHHAGAKSSSPPIAISS